MKDRVVEHPNRYRLVPVPGEQDVVDLVWEPGHVEELGTPYAVHTMLTDQTATLYGLGTDAVPNDVFVALRTVHIVELVESGTWTVPAGVHEIDVFLVGGGDGGISGGNSNYSKSIGGTGGAGGASGNTNYIPGMQVKPAVTYDVVIGAGGAPGQAGEETYFGLYCSKQGSGNKLSGCAGGREGWHNSLKPVNAESGSSSAECTVCPLDGKPYAAPGAGGGGGGSGYGRQTPASGGAGGTNACGISGGSGASGSTGTKGITGGAAPAPSENSGCGGGGGGGGGNGESTSATSIGYGGAGAPGADGKIIIRYYGG